MRGLFCLLTIGVFAMSQIDNRLPAFADDYSEFFISASVEFSQKSDQLELFLVIIMVGHATFFDRPQFPVLMIAPNRTEIQKWKNMVTAVKTKPTSRKTDNLFCRFRDGIFPKFRISKAYFIPTTTTTGAT